jgi:uncharacterized protein (TIGR02596 family)
LNSPAPAPVQPATRAFTLVELMVVIGIIAIALSFLVPALTPATARSLEGAARLFTAELENARQIAIAERTRTRVLIPDKAGNSAAFGSDLALRSFTTVSFNKTADTWKQRGKWIRLPEPATFDPAAVVDPATEQNIIAARNGTVTKVDNTTTGIAASKTFTGAYVEFRPNGATSLDPTSPKEVAVLADGIPDGSGGMTVKNPKLRYRIAIDPLTGSALLQ